MTLSLNLRLAIASHYSEQARSRWMQCSQVAWNDLAHEATVNRLAPLLYYSLTKFPRTDVPDVVLEKLRTVYYATAARNMQMHEQLKQVTDALDEIGVRYILLKGAALIQDVYEGNMGLRPMSDIDILIDPAQFSVARTKIETFATPKALIVADDFSLHHQSYYLDDDVCIELHSRLLSLGHYINKPSFEALWDSQQGMVGFSAEYQFVHLCAHAFFHHRHTNTHFGADAAFVSQLIKDWDLVVQIAVQNSLVESLKMGMDSLRKDWLFAPVYLESPDLSYLSATLLERFYMFCVARPVWRRFAQWVSLPTRQDKIKFIKAKLFPSKEYLLRVWPTLDYSKSRWKVYLQRLSLISSRLINDDRQ